MRMPTSPVDRADEEAGFTLVELLAVLTLLSFAVAAFAFRTVNSFDTADFRALLVNAASGMRAARSDAIRNHHEQVFVINAKQRRMSSPAMNTVLKIPPDVDVTVTAAKSLTMADGATGIKFYADGSSSGGSVDIAWNARKYAINVNWLTGNVALDGL